MVTITEVVSQYVLDEVSSDSTTFGLAQLLVS
jgi:hypothetical protein